MTTVRLARRHLVVHFVMVLVGVVALSVSGLAAAQAYPNRPVTLVVPFAVGSSTDMMTRLVAKGLSERLNAVFIVENKPGANGTIAADFVAHTITLRPGEASPTDVQLLAVVSGAATSTTVIILASVAAAAR